jgi:nitrogen fixation protein FixH
MSTPFTTILPQQKRAGRRWIVAVVGLLILQMGLTLYGVGYAIRGGKSAAVEDDYYNKALHWDDHEALVRASAALGWKAQVTVGDAATTEGDHALMIQLNDATGKALEGAQINVAYFHHAAPLDLQQVTLKATGGGMYAASAPLKREGIWEFRITIHRPQDCGCGTDTFIQTTEQDLFE